MINIDDSIKTKKIESLLENALSGEGVNIKDINIKLVTDEKIKQINRDYSSKDELTDVLSFTYSEKPYSGDIVIAEGVANKQAKQSSTTLENEHALLCLHGFLHIIGYDHQTKEQQGEMDNLHKKYLNQIGFKYRNFNWQDS